MPYLNLLTSQTNTIDTAVVDSILDITSKILEMFTVFPLNVFLTAGLIGVGVGVFRKLKRS